MNKKRGSGHPLLFFSPGRVGNGAYDDHMMEKVKELYESVLKTAEEVEV